MTLVVLALPVGVISKMEGTTNLYASNRLRLCSSIVMEPIVTGALGAGHAKWSGSPLPLASACDK